jgi:hypothetical protein
MHEYAFLDFAVGGEVLGHRLRIGGYCQTSNEQLASVAGITHRIILLLKQGNILSSATKFFNKFRGDKLINSISELNWKRGS